MNWKTKHPQLYRILAKLRFSLAREKTIQLPFGAKMKVNPHSYVERCIYEGSFENWRIEFFRSSIVRIRLFDIGANVGLFSLLAAAQGANVNAFEPEPMNLSRLRAICVNLHLANKVKVWPLASGQPCW
jgi:2-polyprenyl-3-methyl-5-hydroxy-6-metoxy-1,4-benzoquinol methylase